MESRQYWYEGSSLQTADLWPRTYTSRVSKSRPLFTFTIPSASVVDQFPCFPVKFRNEQRMQLESKLIPPLKFDLPLTSLHHFRLNINSAAMLHRWTLPYQKVLQQQIWDVVVLLPASSSTPQFISEFKLKKNMKISLHCRRFRNDKSGPPFPRHDVSVL